MTDSQTIDLAALRAERANLLAHVAAIDKVLASLTELEGGDWLQPRGTSSGSPRRSGRDRRSKAEVDEIKSAVLREVAAGSGSKVEIFDRLRSADVVADSRRDSELVLRTLKDYSDESLLEVSDGIYSVPPNEEDGEETSQEDSPTQPQMSWSKR